jgi:undecaprenyl-diphosphatase
MARNSGSNLGRDKDSDVDVPDNGADEPTAPPPSNRLTLLRQRWFWPAWCVTAAITVALTLAARHAGPLPGDVAIAQAVQRAVDSGPIAGLLDGWNYAGTGLPALLITVALGCLFVAVRRWDLLALFAVSNLLRPLSAVLKELIRRPRPTEAYLHLREHNTDFSFPSGHVFTAAVCFGALAVLIEQTDLPRPLRRGIQAISVAIVLLMGAARVYAGAHWPSDALGSILWAGLLLSFVLRVGGRFSDARHGDSS